MIDTNNFFEKIRFKYIQPNEKKGIKYKILKKIKKTFNKNDIINLDKSKLSSEDLVFLDELEKIKDTAHMSTPAIALMINNICRSLSEKEVFLILEPIGVLARFVE